MFQALTLSFGASCEPITRHVDEVEVGLGFGEEVQLLRAARRIRSARQPQLSDERIDEARLADVRAPGEGDFRTVVGRQVIEIGRAARKRPGTREEAPAFFDRLPPTWGP